MVSLGLNTQAASKTSSQNLYHIWSQTLSTSILPNGLSPHKTASHAQLHNVHCSNEFWRATPGAATPSLCGPPCGPHCGGSDPTIFINVVGMFIDVFLDLVQLLMLGLHLLDGFFHLGNLQGGWITGCQVRILVPFLCDYSQLYGSTFLQGYQQHVELRYTDKGR